MSTNHIGHKFSFTQAFTEEVVPRGTVHFNQGRYYVFAYNFGADSTAVGDVVSTSTTFVKGNVSTTAATIEDYTDGTTIRPLVGGVCGAVIATTQFGWLWFWGTGTHAITTDGNVAAADYLVVTNGAKIAVRTTTEAHIARSIGIAHAADVSTTLSSTSLFGGGIFPWGFGS